MFGTSPAYIFSLYTTDFTVDDYIKGLHKLKAAGFDGYQGEIFAEERLPEWEKGAKRIREAADSLGMV